jgi:hypothetical protein
MREGNRFWPAPQGDANLSILPSVYIDINDICRWLGLTRKDSLNALVHKGWLQRSGLRIFMHQVIREAVAHQTQPTCRQCNKLINSIADHLHYKPGENPLEKKVYLPFADSILHHLSEEDRDLATLASNLSVIYRELGKLYKALEYQQRQ